MPAIHKLHSPNMVKTLGDLAKGRKAWSSVLDTLMPGGANWVRFENTKTGDCDPQCPGRRDCDGSGPGGRVCSSKWEKAEANPLILHIVGHVLQKFEHYDRGDSKVGSVRKEVEALRIYIQRQAELASDEGFAEGGEKSRLQKYRERYSGAARAKKQDALAEGHLCCEGCDVDYLSLFEKEEALRIVECHHKNPFSSLKFAVETKISELALLCANCHRLAHSRVPPLTILEIKARRKRAEAKHASVRR